MAKDQRPRKQTPRTRKAGASGPTPFLKIAGAHAKPVTALAFAPDARTLVSGSDDATVRLWDAGTGEACSAGVMNEARWGIAEVAFSPDGRVVAAVSQGVNQPVAGQTRVFLWDLIKRKSVEQNADSFIQLRSPTFAPDGRIALLGGGVRLLDAAGEPTGELPQAAKGDRIAFSPDGAQVVFGDWEGTLHVLDVGKGEETHALEGHTDHVTALAFSPDGRSLVSSTSSHGKEWEPRRQDRTIRLWDFQARKQLSCWSGGWDTTSCLVFLADNRHLLSFHDPHSKACVNLWSVQGQEPLASWTPPGATTAVAVWSRATDRPARGLIATGHGDGHIYLWDIADVLPGPGIGQARTTPSSEPASRPRRAASPKPGKAEPTSPRKDELDEYFPPSLTR